MSKTYTDFSQLSKGMFRKSDPVVEAKPLSPKNETGYGALAYFGLNAPEAHARVLIVVGVVCMSVKRHYIIAMFAAFAAATAVSAIHPHSIAVWITEMFWPSPTIAAFFAVMTTVAMAGLWELIEWQYAVIDGGEAGAAFLGSQGDEWDAQKDILCDTLGALCAVSAFLITNRKDK